jgi:hypothetical protein
MKTHSIEKPYRCDICDKEHTTSRNLGRHMKKHLTQASLEEIKDSGSLG